MYNQRILEKENAAALHDQQGSTTVCLPDPRGLWKDNPIKEQNEASLTTQTVSDRSQPLTVDFTR